MCSYNFRFSLWYVKNLEVIALILTTRKKLDKVKMNNSFRAVRELRSQGISAFKTGDMSEYRKLQLTGIKTHPLEPETGKNT